MIEPSIFPGKAPWCLASFKETSNGDGMSILIMTYVTFHGAEIPGHA
jgi:hypothetical protein